eukprot:15449553-Alexandrium_andersonii.AAC.1
MTPPAASPSEAGPVAAPSESAERASVIDALLDDGTQSFNVWAAGAAPPQEHAMLVEELLGADLAEADQMESE